MKLSLDYIAGLIDADGSFSVSVKFRKGKYTQIEICPVVNFRCLDLYREVAESVQGTLGVGKIYDHSGGPNFKMVTWQTTKKLEALEVAERLIPYLHIKKDIAIEFADITRIWLTSIKKDWNSHSGVTARPKEVIVSLAKRAIDLNLCNQTETNREKRLLTLKKIEEFLGS